MGNAQSSKDSERVKPQSFRKRFEDGVVFNPVEKDLLPKPTVQSRPDFLRKLSTALSVKSTDSNEVITRYQFTKNLFKDNYLGHLLFTQLCFLAKAKNFNELSLNSFLDSCELTLEMHTSENIIVYYCQMFAGQDHPFDMKTLNKFIYCCYYSSLCTYPNFDLDNFESASYLIAIIHSILHGKDSVSQGFVKNWIKKHIPNVCVALHSLIVDVLTTGYSKLTTASATACIPLWEAPSPTSCTELECPLKWAISSSLPPLFSITHTAAPRIKKEDITSAKAIISSLGLTPSCLMADPPSQSKTPLLFSFQWTSLYDSDRDGLSLSRFEALSFGYRGPWVMLVTSEESNEYCVAGDSGWKESCNYWGGPDCRLMEIYPHFSIVEAGEKIIYYNSKFRGYPFGILVGPEPSRPALKVAHCFTKMEFKGIPFRLKRIQVYGCGSEEVKQNHVKQMNWERKEAHKHRNINVERLNWNENPDKYLLELTRSSFGNAV